MVGVSNDSRATNTTLVNITRESKKIMSSFVKNILGGKKKFKDYLSSQNETRLSVIDDSKSVLKKAKKDIIFKDFNDSDFEDDFYVNNETSIDEIKVASDNSFYDANCGLSSNMMIVGKPGQGKTTFIQNLIRNGYYPSVKKVFWISPSTVSKNFKKNNAKIIKDSGKSLMYFEADSAENLSIVIGEIEDVLDSLNEEDYEDKNPSRDFGESIEMSKNLVVFDDMTGIADSSKDLLHFLTTARKKSCSTISIFHVLLQSGVGRNILSSINKIVLFSLNLNTPNLISFLSNIGEAYESRKNLRKNQGWLNNHFSKFIRREPNAHLLIEMDGGNSLIPNGPSIFRTNAAGKDKQICYFPRKNNGNIVDSYCAQRTEGTMFQIVSRTVCLANNVSYKREDVVDNYKSASGVEKSKEKKMILDDEDDDVINSDVEDFNDDRQNKKDRYERERQDF